MRRRSRSRSPLRTPSWMKAPAVKSSSKSAVNMLDPEAIELSRNNKGEKKNFSNRITCTIPGNSRGRGRMMDRMSDRRIVSVRRSDDFRADRSDDFCGDGFNRNRGRGGIHSRITREAPRANEDEDHIEDKKNGFFRDSDKPIQRLVDPTFVPKGRGFFDHDDRGGNDSKWRGRTSYDPRIDFGSRRGRGGRHSWDDRRARPDDRRHDTDRSFDRFDKSRADGLWTHDKYMELEDGSTPSEGVEVLVDQRKDSARRVKESD